MRGFTKVVPVVVLFLVFSLSAPDCWGQADLQSIPHLPNHPPPLRTLNESSHGTIYFYSSSPVGFRPLLKAEESKTTVTAGDLLIPEGAVTARRVPAMVILHGSGGIRAYRERDYATRLAKHGIATLVVDSFGSRGVTSETPYETAVLAVAEADLVADAYAALRILQTHPLIDPERIGVMGFSYGGMAARFALDERIFRSQTTREFPFALHVDFYGPCFLDLGTQQTTGASLLSLRGGLDGSNSLVDCASTENGLRKAGSSVGSHTFSGAGHGWESPTLQTFVKTLNPVACQVAVDPDGNLTFDGRVFAAPQGADRADWLYVRSILLGELMKSCMQDGYLIGGNPAADEAARRASVEFIENELFKGLGWHEATHRTSKQSSSFRMSADNLPIFGSQLFQGAFQTISTGEFNSDYLIAVGDQIDLMLWGEVNETISAIVDEQGNIVVPGIGPISVLGVRNAELNSLIRSHIHRVYRDGVEVYSNLRSVQTVKILVSGHVVTPGIYEGAASDSVLYFLDRAGGIDPRRGSYRKVSILRGVNELASIDLYDFLTDGVMPSIQFRDGDAILVASRSNIATVTGDVNNPAEFEFKSDVIPLGDLIGWASPKNGSTHISIARTQSGTTREWIHPISEASKMVVKPNDAVEIFSRNVPETVTVAIEGEHEGPAVLVLPKGAVLADAVELIEPTSRSNLEALQLFRPEVAERQRKLLLESLDNLEESVLHARSSTLDEARLRRTDSETILAFIDHARRAEPRGQILLESLGDAGQIHLEHGDMLFIPAKTLTVTVHGEVNFPNTQTHRERERILDYIERAGGFTSNASRKGLLVRRTNGAIDTVGRGHRARINPGDEIIVLPEPDKKNLQFAKDISTILYQVAIATHVVVKL